MSCRPAPSAVVQTGRRLLAAGVFSLAATLIVGLAPRPAALSSAQETASFTVVGPNLRASSNVAGGNRNEPWIAASPRDPRVLVGVSQLGPTGSPLRCTTLVSRNGGNTWRELQLPGQEEGCFDPLVVFTESGRALVMHTLMRRGERTGTIRFWGSDDDGTSWQGPVELDCPLSPDHPRIVIDRSGGPHDGRLYVVWNEARDTLMRDRFHLFLHASDDEGRTFDEPVAVTVGEGGKLVALDPVVLADGTLVVPYFQYLPSRDGSGERKPVYTIRSPDGGASFEPPEPAFEVGPSAWPHLRADFLFAYSVPVVIADEGVFSPHRGQLYATWDEVRDGVSDILLATSADGGRSWNRPLRVNDNVPVAGDDPPDFRMTPVPAVDERGVLAVAWYDRRDDPARRCWHQYLAASTDGGATFGDNLRVSDAPSCPEPNLAPSIHVGNTAPVDDATRLDAADVEAMPDGPDRAALERQLALAAARGAVYDAQAPVIRVAFDRGRNAWPGHYSGLTSSAAGVFHPLWADRRDGGQALYTARVELHSAPRSPPANLEEVDLTSEVAVLVGAPRFEEAAGRVHFEVQLLNGSDRSLYAPLVVRARPLAAAPQTVGAEGGSAAIRWDFSERLGTERRLPPGAVSGSLTVTLAVSPESGLDRRLSFTVRGRVDRNATGERIR